MMRVFDIRRLSSRFRRIPRFLGSEWPVISVTRPWFYLLRFFGLAPFEISHDRFTCGSYDVVYCFCCTFVYTGALYHVFGKFGIHRDTRLIEIIDTMKVVFNYFVSILNILMAIRLRKKFIGVFNILKHFDRAIRDLGQSQQNESALKIFVWSTGLFSAFMWISVNRIGMEAFVEPWAYSMAYILNYLANSLSVIKFSGVMLLLGQRFRRLNKVTEKSISTTKIKQNLDYDLKVIQQLHNNLMNAGESLSSQYSWPLLLWLMNLCVHSVSNLYFLIDWLLVSPFWGMTHRNIVLCTACWLLIFVSQLLLLHIACHLTSAEANNFGTILINQKCLAASQLYRVESSLHLINRRLNFSAAGCFYVNLPLLRSITAILTTYLVLLFQFQD